MPQLVMLIWTAGAIHLAIVAANFILPGKLNLRENLGRVTPMVRRVFVVHWVYIVFILAIFSAACFLFAPELAGGSRLGRFISAAIAIFWLPRIPIQLFLYDAELRRQHRLGDFAMLAAIGYFVVVFGAAAIGAGA